MEYGPFHHEYGYPFKDCRLKKVIAFLEQSGLDYEDGIEFTVNLCDNNDEIVATGSLQANVLKCIAVSERYKGMGLSATVVTHLVMQAANSGFKHLFLFTKPQSKGMFSELGFYPIAQTADVVLMENVRGGIESFVSRLKCPTKEGIIGSIVANCNPFTRGHLYLIETAAKRCDLLHVFILSEDKSAFPAGVRYRLVREGTAHLPDAVVHETSDYLISSATFPSYFIKDKKRVGRVNSLLDLTIFADYFARALHITRRFVGTEPYCAVTSAYNKQMMEFLPGRGIEVIEIPRCRESGEDISASRVRQLMINGDYAQIERLVPSVTYDFLFSEEGKEIARKLREEKENRRYI